MQKELITIKGIGKWTVEMFLMFELGKPDIFSKGDIALINSVKKNYKMNVLKNTELDKLIKSWAPYNSTASLLLWKSIEEKVFFN
jgi:DNA-3-methyladenine glycosylase II